MLSSRHGMAFLFALACLATATPSSAECAWTGNGTAFDSAAAVAAPLPSGVASDDILLLFVETANEASSISNQNGGVWTEVTNSPQGTGTAGGATSTRITVFWSRYNGTQGNPTVADSGNHQLGAIAKFTGCHTVGDPWNVTSGNVDATDDDSLSMTGATTTVDGVTVVMTATLMDDALSYQNWVNNNIHEPGVGTLCCSGPTLSVGGTAGNDGKVEVYVAVQDAAGDYGTTTATVGPPASTSVKGMMTIALMPPQGPASGTLSLMGVGR